MFIIEIALKFNTGVSVQVMEFKCLFEWFNFKGLGSRLANAFIVSVAGVDLLLSERSIGSGSIPSLEPYGLHLCPGTTNCNASRGECEDASIDFPITSFLGRCTTASNNKPV